MIAKAAYAYDRGITGKGVTIAVLDTGINRSTPEFAGRISADSTGFEQRIAERMAWWDEMRERLRDA